MPRLLILSSDTGEGHNSAARAISEAASAVNFEVSARKPLEESTRLNRSLGQLYNFLLTHRPGWMGVFTSGVNCLRPYERDVCYRWVSGYIRQFIEQEEPDIVLSVHPMLNHLIQRWIAESKLSIPCYTFVTDPFPPFWRGWTSPWVERYFVTTEEAGAQLAAGGVALDSIERVAMPLRAGFHPMTRDDIAETKSSLGIEGDLILINGGARGGGPLHHLVRAVREAAPRSHLLVVCGSNERIRRRLERIGDSRLMPLGFVHDIHRLVGAADLVITKPGALSTYETLASAVPAVFSAIGGLMPQESGLFEAARHRGFGFAVHTLDELRAVVRKGAAEWEPRRHAITDFYKPNAGPTIVERIQLAHAGR